MVAIRPSLFVLIASQFWKNMEMHEYSPGEAVPVTSPLYRVLHDPLEGVEYLQTFYAGDQFPLCPDCGTNVRYLIPIKVLMRSKG